MRTCWYLSSLFLPSLLWGQSYVIQTIAGSDAAGDGTPAVYTSLNQAEGVATDTSGNLYVSDAVDHRVRQVGRDGIIHTLAGNGFPGFRGDGGPAANAQLSSPYGLVVDRGGNVYVADLGNSRVRKITQDGRILTIAGGGTLPLGPANEGSLATDFALSAPRNLAIDSSNALYFSDFGANYVCRVSPEGILTIVAGNGSSGRAAEGLSATASSISAPAGLALDAAGSVFIAESRYGRIRKVSRGFITTAYSGGGSLPVLGTPTGLAIDASGAIYMADGYSGQILKLSANGIVLPISIAARDLAVDIAGNLYAARGQYVWRFNTNGSATLMAGDGKFGYSGDGGAADMSHLYRPAGLAYDGQGNLYIADETNCRIRMVTPAGKITTIAGHGEGGALGDGGAATQATLFSPASVAVDAYGLVYIADTGSNRIRRITTDGMITTFAGTGTRNFSGDGNLARFASFDSPAAVLPDRFGNLYVSDTNNNRIRRISPDGNIVTIAGSSQIAGFGGDNSLAVFAQLNKPTALAFDRNGSLYIADTGNNRIRRLDKYGYISSLPIVDLRGPRGIAVDADDSVFISDTANQRIRKWKPDGTLTTVAGTGRADFDGDNGSALLASLNYPAAVAINPDGIPVIADYFNNRVRKLIPTYAPAAVDAGPVRTVVNAASYLEGPVAPGEAISILGGPFGPSQPATGSATVLGGLQVRFDGVEATLTFVSDKQINATVPPSVAGSKSVTLELYSNGSLVSSRSVPVAAAAVGVFTNPGVAGQVLALNPDNTLNTPDNPVKRGDVLAIFVTGEGAGPVSVYYAGYESEVIYSSGGQVNFRVPAGFIPTGTMPLVVRAGGSESQAGVAVSVR
jgi:uncharacterized protein (TIGR03437 family)